MDKEGRNQSLSLDVVQEESNNLEQLSNDLTSTNTSNSTGLTSREVLKGRTDLDEEEIDELDDPMDSSSTMNENDAANLLASVALGSHGGIPLSSSNNNNNNNALASTSTAGNYPSASPSLPNPLPPGYNKDLPICQNCSTQTTPLWRRSHDSTQVLCNACALFFKMKGRPRPISLKTDVIKQRNRSKGKSTSKDRLGSSGTAVAGITNSNGSSKKSRGDSTSRTREEGKAVGKSSTGGSEMDDDELDQQQQESSGRKSRKVVAGVPYPPMPGYPNPGAYPYPYPYQQPPHPHPHPHQHQPYPPPRSRSRSTSTTRRAPSAEGNRNPYSAGQVRGVNGESSSSTSNSNINPYSYPPPPPGGYLPQGSHENYYPYYPGYPYYPPPPPGTYASHPAHSMQPLPNSSIQHAQSDSRSQSPSGPKSEPTNDSPRSSASPPHLSSSSNHHHNNQSSSAYYSQPSLHYPYNNSPLSSSTLRDSNDSRPTTATPSNLASIRLGELQDRLTLAPMNRSGSVSGGTDNGGGSRNGSRERVVLPSIGSVTPTISGTSSPLALSLSNNVPNIPHIQRHTALFESRFPATEIPTSLPSNLTTTALNLSDSLHNHNNHHLGEEEMQSQENQPSLDRKVRGDSVASSNSAASGSGSSDGGRGEIRSPVIMNNNLPWGTNNPPPTMMNNNGNNNRWDGGDERRGRSSRRSGAIEEESERSLHNNQISKSNNGSSRERDLSLGGRMVGVQSGFEELRVGGNGVGGNNNYHIASPRENDIGYSNGNATDSSRSRSSGGNNAQSEERDRGRGGFSQSNNYNNNNNNNQNGNGNRSGSTSRAISTSRNSNGNGVIGISVPQARSSSNGSSTGRLSSIDEVARLKTKINELTFLNSLMQSRLGQLERPGQVPSAPVFGKEGANLTPPEHAGSEVEEDIMMDESNEVVVKTAEDEELDRYGVTASDPTVRASLLQFFRSQQKAPIISDVPQ